MTGLILCSLIFKHLLFVASQPKEQQLRQVTQNMFSHVPSTTSIW